MILKQRLLRIFQTAARKRLLKFNFRLDCFCAFAGTALPICGFSWRFTSKESFFIRFIFYPPLPCQAIKSPPKSQYAAKVEPPKINVVTCRSQTGLEQVKVFQTCSKQTRANVIKFKYVITNFLSANSPPLSLSLTQARTHITPNVWLGKAIESQKFVRKSLRFTVLAPGVNIINLHTFWHYLDMMRNFLLRFNTTVLTSHLPPPTQMAK